MQPLTLPQPQPPLEPEEPEPEPEPRARAVLRLGPGATQVLEPEYASQAASQEGAQLLFNAQSSVDFRAAAAKFDEVPARARVPTASQQRSKDRPCLQ